MFPLNCIQPIFFFLSLLNAFSMDSKFLCRFVDGMFLYILYNFFFKSDCVLFVFHAKVRRIRCCGNFPRTNQATSTELYIATRKNTFDTREVLKTFEIQQYIGFFEIAGLLEVFTACINFKKFWTFLFLEKTVSENEIARNISCRNFKNVQKCSEERILKLALKRFSLN